MDDQRPTVPWIPGMRAGAEFSGEQLRELFDVAAAIRARGLGALDAVRVAVGAWRAPETDPDKRKGMLVGCALQMGIIA